MSRTEEGAAVDAIDISWTDTESQAYPHLSTTFMTNFMTFI